MKLAFFLIGLFINTMALAAAPVMVEDGDTVNVNQQKVSNDIYFSSSWEIQDLASLEGGFTYIKRYQVKGKSGQSNKVSYSKVLSKNAIYHYSIHPSVSMHGVRVEVYNSSNELIISNHRHGRYYQALDFLVEKTGVYYLKVTFENPNSSQAELILGFKRK